MVMCVRCRGTMSREEDRIKGEANSISYCRCLMCGNIYFLGTVKWVDDPSLAFSTSKLLMRSVFRLKGSMLSATQAHADADTSAKILPLGRQMPRKTYGKPLYPLPKKRNQS